MIASNDPQATARPPRHRWAVVLAAVLAVLGLALLGYGLAAQQGSPPTPAATPVAAPVRAAPASSPESSTPRAELPASAPASLRIPAIEVSSAVNSVGLNPDRTMAVPQPGPLYDQAAWYRGSPTPGERGPSVIIGHVDSAANGPSVFYELGALKAGDRIEVTRADRTTATFAVDAVRTFPKDAFPTQTVYGDTADPELRLITCGGPFDSTAASYRDNTVVFASQLT